MMSEARMKPLEAPFEAVIEAAFETIMPKGMAPLNIFKTLAKHPELFRHQMALGGILLYKGVLDRVERELILHRTCALCGSEYEWGVHVTGFARPLGFSEEKIRATVLGSWDDPVWDARESVLIRFADELHETSTISDELWELVREGWSEAQLLEMIAIVGNYHGISYFTNALRMDLEESGARFPKEG